MNELELKKELSLATFQYAQDHNEMYPDLSSPAAIRAALDPYMLDKSVFECGTTHQSYLGNTTLSNASIATVNDPDTTVLFYEADAKHLHLDGSNIA